MSINKHVLELKFKSPYVSDKLKDFEEFDIYDLYDLFKVRKTFLETLF